MKVRSVSREETATGTNVKQWAQGNTLYEERVFDVVVVLFLEGLESDELDKVREGRFNGIAFVESYPPGIIQVSVIGDQLTVRVTAGYQLSHGLSDVVSVGNDVLSKLRQLFREATGVKAA